MAGENRWLPKTLIKMRSRQILHWRSRILVAFLIFGTPFHWTDGASESPPKTGSTPKPDAAVATNPYVKDKTPLNARRCHRSVETGFRSHLSGLAGLDCPRRPLRGAADYLPSLGRKRRGWMVSLRPFTTARTEQGTYEMVLCLRIRW